MKKCLFVLTLVIITAFPISNYSQTTGSKFIRRPAITLEEALVIGKAYAEQKQIDVSEYYIDSVRLDLNPRGDRGKFWELRWEKNEDPAKGSYILLHIYMDRQVERLFAK